MQHQQAQDFWELKDKEIESAEKAYQAAFPGHRIPFGAPGRGMDSLSKMHEALRTGVPCKGVPPPPGAIY